MAITERFTLRELLREPKRVSDAVDHQRRLIITRRNAPDLLLTRSDFFNDELAGAGAVARMLRNLTVHVGVSESNPALLEAFPWSRYLSERGRTEFLSELVPVLEACSELDTLVPFGQFLAEWKSTAAVRADPELYARLTEAIDKPDARPVLQPQS